MEKLIINCETGETETLEMTAEELATYEAIAAENAQALQAKENARAQLLEKLGITQEEAALLLS